MKNYKFKTKPYDHQQTALEASWSDPYHALFMEMGTGKSKVTIDNIGVLYEQGEINAALIVAPKGVYDNWVKGEIPNHLPDHIDRYVMRWTPSTSKKYARELDDFMMEDFNGIKFFVVNVHNFCKIQHFPVYT